jgi:glutamate:GABA antiporter
VSTAMVPEEFEVTQAQSVESAKLQKHFGRFDILFFLVCTLVGLDTIGSVANKGPTAFFWLIVLAVIFFFPYAMLTAELGVLIPEEGGCYVWSRMAFGRLIASVNNFLYWITNPVWIGGSLAITGFATFSQFFLNGSQSNVWFYTFGLLFVWISIVAAILSFEVGKWLPTIGAYARFIILGVFAISVVLYAVKHGVHGYGFSSYFPSSGSDIFKGIVLLMPILIFNYVGFELPNAAGDEMKNPQRDIPFGIARSGVLGVILYAIPILGILVVLPASAIQNLSGFITASQTVFTVYGGHVASDGTVILTGFGKVLGDLAAITFIICLLTSGTTWIMGSDRSMAVSGWDGAAPRFLGNISAKFGTPVNVNIMSGITATIILVGSHMITSGGNASLQRNFGAVLALTISTTLVSYLGIFPALAILRRKMPDAHRPFKAPAATFISALLTLLILWSSIQLFLPGIGSTGKTGGWFGSDYAASGFAHSERLFYFELEFGALLVFIAIGVLFYILGAPTRRTLVGEDPALVAAGVTPDELNAHSHHPAHDADAGEGSGDATV